MKTTSAMQAPKPLLLAAEKGYKALKGVHAVDINSWVDILTVAAQLQKPEVREKYSTIVIDTLDELVFMAEEYVTQQAGVAQLNDIPWGQGHATLGKMFRKLFKQITQHYGLIIVAHESKKVDPDDEENRYSTLAINKKVKGIVIGLLDILTYVDANRDPDSPNTMHFRSSENWEAKSRFANIVPSAVFNYDNLEKAIHDAVDGIATKEEHKDYYGGDDSTDSVSQEEYEKLRDKVLEVAVAKINEMGQGPVVELISITLGKKISETNIHDWEPLKALLIELENL